MKAGMVAVADLHPHPSNVREDLGDLTELAASIQSLGLLQPLVIKPRTAGGWTVIDGHRRRGALKLTPIARVLCLMQEPGDLNRDVATMLAASMHKQLNPIEQANAFTALKNRGQTIQQIARASGFSTRTIGARLILLNLPPEAQDLVAANRLSLADAEKLSRELAKKPTGSTRPASVKKAVWLTRTHPLAAAVKAACQHTGTRTVVGGVGCGQCWEHTIRTDALTPATLKAAA